jgi:hypothetical protein
MAPRVTQLNCRIGRSYPRPQQRRFSFDSFLQMLKWRAFNIAVAIVFLSWLGRSVWDEAGIGKLVLALAGEQKANPATISDVPNRSCKVSVTDLDGIEHTAQVTADTLYEAVARGLKAIRESVWAGELPEGLNTVTVCAAHPEVEHHVKVSAFKAWLNRNGGSPADKIARLRIREILGL